MRELFFSLWKRVSENGTETHTYIAFDQLWEEFTCNIWTRDHITNQ